MLVFHLLCSSKLAHKHFNLKKCFGLIHEPLARGTEHLPDSPYHPSGCAGCPTPTRIIKEFRMKLYGPAHILYVFVLCDFCLYLAIIQLLAVSVFIKL